MCTLPATAARSRCPAAPDLGQPRDFCRPRCTAAGFGRPRDFCRPRCTAAGFGLPRDFCRPRCPTAFGSGHLRGLHHPHCDAASESHRSCRDQALGYHSPRCHFFSLVQHAAAGPREPRVPTGSLLANRLSTPTTIPTWSFASPS